jgi:hypothetical protein
MCHDCVPRSAVGGSFLLTSLLGASFIYSAWAAADLVGAVQRSAAFVTAMVLLHVAGCCAYLPQKHQTALLAPSEPAETASLETGWPAMASTRSWKLCWLAASIVCLVQAVRQLIAGHEFRERVLESGRSLESVPPTMLGSQPATGVAFVCFRLVCGLIAFRRSSISFRDE